MLSPRIGSDLAAGEATGVRDDAAGVGARAYSGGRVEIATVQLVRCKREVVQLADRLTNGIAGVFERQQAFFAELHPDLMRKRDMTLRTCFLR